MLQTRSDLFCSRRSKDGTGYTGCEETLSDESCEAGLVARTTTSDDRNILGLSDGRRITIDDLVGQIEDESRICASEGLKCSMDGEGGICDKVL